MEQTAVEWLIKQMVQSTTMKGWIEIFDKAKEMEKQQIIEHSVELAKLLFSNPIEKSGKTPQELVDNYFKNK
jgi:hypothetical protein